MLGIIIAFIVGVIAGVILVFIKSGRGYFRLHEVEKDTGYYSVQVRLFPDNKMLKKKTILLIYADEFPRE